ncbi:MAG TPA: hypothetical protein VL995_10840 [Cellvibrio sp.]|nr:hypothetical protein [Cellvibrio sp.]
MKKPTIVATILTVLLVLLFATLLYIRRGELPGLTLNELGDFTAGFAAPLAFIWLVAGYIQQGKELQLNTDALKAQQRELKLQVEATKQLVEQSDRQAASNETMAKAALAEMQKRMQDEEESKLVEFEGKYSHAFLLETVAQVDLECIKGQAKDIKIVSIPHGIKAEYDGKYLIRTGDKIVVQFDIESLSGADIERFELEYIDTAGNPRKAEYEIKDYRVYEARKIEVKV